ncbi:MAG: hypothetical protein ACLSE7_08720 [Lachnospirales bacterium]
MGDVLVGGLPQPFPFPGYFGVEFKGHLSTQVSCLWHGLSASFRLDRRASTASMLLKIDYQYQQGTAHRRSIPAEKSGTAGNEKSRPLAFGNSLKPMDGLLVPLERALMSTRGFETPRFEKQAFRIPKTAISGNRHSKIKIQLFKPLSFATPWKT